MPRYKNRRSVVSGGELQGMHSGEGEEFIARYGLPRDVRFCSRCVISNQRPNSTVEYQHNVESEKKTIAFDRDEVCDACRAVEKKKREIDWTLRETELRELCDKHRKNGSAYDCLVPGSGGKDSFFAAHLLKYTYGMNPLTVTWAPHLYTDWGWRNFQAWTNAGFSNYLVTPDPKNHRLITRIAVENLFHPFQPFIVGQKALAPKMGAMFGIPLVFYGENEAEYGNPIEDTETAKRDWSYFSEDNLSNIFLGGSSIDRLQAEFGMNPVDLDPYMPLDPQVVKDQNISVHYLGYYVPCIRKEPIITLLKMAAFKPLQREHQVRTANTIVLTIRLTIFTITQPL